MLQERVLTRISKPSSQSVEFMLFLICLFSTPLVEGFRNSSLVLFTLVWCINRYAKRDFRFAWDPWNIVICCFLASLLLTQFSVFFFDDLPTKLSHVFRYGLLALMLRYCQFSGYQLKALLVALLTSVFFGAMPGCFEYFQSGYFKDLQLLNIQHVNHASLYMLYAIQITLVTWAYFWVSRNQRWFFSFSLLSAILFIWLLNAQSRLAISMALFSILLVLFYIYLFDRKTVLRLGLVLILTATGLLSMETGVFKKHQQWVSIFGSDEVLTPRERISNVALLVWKDKPWLGAGYDQYKSFTEEVIRPAAIEKHGMFDRKQYMFKGHAHNLYFNYLVEYGLVGLTALLIMLFYGVFYLLRTVRSAMTDAHALMWWSLLANSWVLLMIGGLVTTTLRRDTAFLFFVVLGLYLSHFSQSAEESAGKAKA